MMRFIKLECRRNHLLSYFYGILGIFSFTLLIGSLFSAIPKIEKNTLASQIFMEQDMLIIMISMISMSGFAILSSIMHAKFIIEEYTSKKNILLFTYPQKRSYIFIVKLVFIFFFTFTMMLIVNLMVISFINIIGNMTGILDAYFENIGNIIMISIIFSLLANFISMLSLMIGFWKKSIIATLITTIIFIAPIGSSVLFIKNNIVLTTIPLLIVLSSISILLFRNLLKKINEMECV